MKIETLNQVNVVSKKEVYYLRIKNKAGTEHVMNVGKSTVDKIRAMEDEDRNQMTLPLENQDDGKTKVDNNNKTR